MKLFYASGSPYARIVRIAVRETGLDREVEEIEVALRDPESALLPYNPGGKVPTLQLDDGTILTETLLILPFLDTRHGGRKLLPMDGSDGWRTLAGLGRAIAFLDGISVWNRELRFGQSAPGVISLETTRAERVADGLERLVSEGAYSGEIDAAQIVLGVALDNCSRRHKVWHWRPGRARLAAWADEIASRPSFAATIQPEINL
ncbi:MAG: glutathione S-transferase family protein [Alphaproteobacteria bacterium]|nr:glutathione S-transferase family protein [Alphaproteobacteria bacterium]